MEAVPLRFVCLRVWVEDCSSGEKEQDLGVLFKVLSPSGESKSKCKL